MAFPYIIVFLVLLQAHSGEAQLKGPSGQVVAAVGGDVVLPCHLEPARNASDLRVEWARPDLAPGYIHVRARGREDVRVKQPSYRGRTALLASGLNHGDISLKLFNVTVSDQGTYRCLAPTLGQLTYVQLAVEAVSSPVITLIKESGLTAELQCGSGGWYPEPELLWLDSEGDLLPAGPPQTLRGPDDLYTVSSRVTVEKRSSSSSITCRVQQKETNQTRETHFLVPEEFCQMQQHPAGAYLVSGWVILIAILAVFIIAILIFSLRRRNQLKTNCKGNKKKPSPTIDIHKGWTVPEKELSLIKVIQQDSYIGAPLTGRLEVVQPMNLVYI